MLPDLFEHVKNAPILSAMVALVGTFLTAYLGGLGRKAADHFSLPKKHRSSSKPVVNSSLAGVLEKNARPLTSPELLDCYNQEQHYQLQIGGQTRRLPACFALQPQEDGKVTNQKIDFSFDSDLFELDAALDSLTKDAFGKVLEQRRTGSLYDGSMFRLRSIKKSEDRTVIDIQRTTYFRSLRTNFMLDQKLAGHSKSLRDLVTIESGKLGDFASSRLSNHIGLVVMVETSDGQLLVQNRSGEVAIRANTLSSSVSGTFEGSDFSKDVPYISMEHSLGGIIREIQGEMGAVQVDADNIYFLGLLREYRRGGFPDFYFLWEAPYTLETIQNLSKYAQEDFEFINYEGYHYQSKSLEINSVAGRRDFEDRVSKIFVEVEDNANLTLKLGLSLAFEHHLRVHCGNNDGV